MKNFRTFSNKCREWCRFGKRERQRTGGQQQQCLAGPERGAVPLAAVHWHWCLGKAGRERFANLYLKTKIAEKSSNFK